MMSNVTDTVTRSGSHCWEPDGSFHVVCLFVIAVSTVCFFISVLSVYRIIMLVLAGWKENADIHSTIKMYKLAPMSRDMSNMEMTTLGHSVSQSSNPNSIETVESVQCRLPDREEGPSKGECIC